jgi:hypothetical protein
MLAHSRLLFREFNMFNGLHSAKIGSRFSICGPAHVIETECFAGHVWYDATSRDGVAVRIARRRQYASGRREPVTELKVVCVGTRARDKDYPVYAVGAKPWHSG